MKKVQEKLSKVADLAESEAAKAAMELIPNDPFPAGTLVKGLVSVMVIGVVGLLLSLTFCVSEADYRGYQKSKRKHLNLQWTWLKM